MSYSPIGDTIALVNTTWSLYNDVYLPAQRAPKDVKDLVKFLDLFRILLYKLRQAQSANINEEFIEQCNDLLEGDLRDVCTKYEKLASAGPKARDLVLRLKWVNKKRDVAACQQRLFTLWRMAIDNHNLTNPDGHQIVQNTINLFNEPFGKQGLQLNTTKAAPSVPSLPPESPKSPKASFQSSRIPIRRKISTHSSLASQSNGDHGRRSSRSVTSSAIEFKESLYRRRTVSTSQAGIPEDPQLEEDLARVDAINASFTRSTLITSLQAWPKSSIASINLNVAEAGNNVIETQDITYMKRDIIYSIPENVERALEDQRPVLGSSSEIAYWLQLALWWIVKAFCVQDICSEIDSTDERDNDQHEEGYYAASLNIHKSSYIFHKIIIPSLESGTRVTDAQHVLIEGLAKTLRNLSEEELQTERLSGKDRLRSEALDLTERMVQQVEQEDQVPVAIDDAGPISRWLTIDHTHAGAKDERVIFRTFVDAEIGEKGNILRSENLPYMLILAVKSRGKLFLSLINQSGTVRLSRQLSDEDIIASRNLDGTSEESFDFPAQHVKIYFMTVQDRNRFWEQPNQHFASTRDYTPRTGEFPLFQGEIIAVSSRDRFSNVESEFSQVRTPGEFFAISLYETLPENVDEYWQVTRRLVICTEPGRSDSWAMSWWLPPAQVVLSRSQGSEVNLEFSDFRNLRRSEINGFDHFSCVYDSQRKNASIVLNFKTTAAAEEFERCILQPYESPFGNRNIRLQEQQEAIRSEADINGATFLIDPSIKSQKVQVFRIEYSDTEASQSYRAITKTNENMNSQRTTDLVFAYRFQDFEVNPIKHTIKLNSVQEPEYISNMVGLKHHPGKASVPRTPAHLETRSSYVNRFFEFADAKAVEAFMLALTDYQLVFYRRVSLSLNPSRLSKTIKYEGAVVMLWWQKDADDSFSKLCLTLRAQDGPVPTWISVAVRKTCARDMGSLRVTFSNIEYRLGTLLDLKNMLVGEESPLKKGRNLSITFAIDPDVRNFDDAVNSLLKQQEYDALEI